MIISTTYEVKGMEYLYVQLTNAPQTVRVNADKVEEDQHTNTLIATKNGKTVGKFPMNNVLGWWTSGD